MVAKLNEVLYCWFQKGQASSRRSDENRWQRKPQPLDEAVQQPSTSCGRSEPILLHPMGCEARKTPADAGVFFLDFYLFRTYQEVAGLRSRLPQAMPPQWAFLCMALYFRVNYGLLGIHWSTKLSAGENIDCKIIRLHDNPQCIYFCPTR
jgi:hypothetical protein